LTSLRTVQPDVRALIIVLEAEAMLVEDHQVVLKGHQVVLEGCFKNTNTGHMVIRLSNDIGHHLWLQGPLNHLGGERRAN
jgi:hypothetical protein